MQTRFSEQQLQDPGTRAAEGILRKCVHCGFCTATCPTYVLLGDELDSPRGRIYLIKDMLENDRAATADVVQHLDRCLSCLSCMTTCPSGVHYQHLIDHARVHVERTWKRSLPERLLRALLARVLPYPRRLRAALTLAALAWPLRGWLPIGLRAMLELSRAGGHSRLRATAPVAQSRNAPVPAATRGTVALLEGCAQGVLQPEAHAATERLLRRAGFEVLRVSGCCGALVHHLGREAHSHALAEALIARLRALETQAALQAVVVNASGCGTQLKDFGYMLREDAQLAADAAWAASLARDVTEVLEGCLPPRVPDLKLPVVVYHSACSLQHGQKLDALPRRLLSEAGFTVRAPAEAHLCCGSAGTYNILQPQLASQLRDRKLANLARTQAEVIASGNAGCTLQLRSGGVGVPVVHTVELLDWACGGPRPW